MVRLPQLLKGVPTSCCVLRHIVAWVNITSTITIRVQRASGLILRYAFELQFSPPFDAVQQSVATQAKQPQQDKQRSSFTSRDLQIFTLYQRIYSITLVYSAGLQGPAL